MDRRFAKPAQAKERNQSSFSKVSVENLLEKPLGLVQPFTNLKIIYRLSFHETTGQAPFFPLLVQKMCALLTSFLRLKQKRLPIGFLASYGIGATFSRVQHLGPPTKSSF